MSITRTVQTKRGLRSSSLRFKTCTGRAEQGSAIAEFGPALFILFFCALFPTLDLMGIGLSYISCADLNNLQLREAVKVPKSQAQDPNGTVMKTIPDNWRATVSGGLGATIAPPDTDVIYEVGKGFIYVTVSTTFTIAPYFSLPLMGKVPALGAPFVTTISHRRVLENPRFAVQ